MANTRINKNKISEMSQKKKHKCKICDEELLSRHFLQSHLAFVHGGKIFECTFCSKKFLQSANLSTFERKK